MDDSTPVGHGDYEVQPGDCVYSIAAATGHYWETIWNHPANAELKRVRENPRTLMAGDRVMIPPLRIKSVRVAIDQLHQFKRPDVPTWIEVQLLREGKPQKDVPYKLVIDGVIEHVGATNGSGELKHPLMPTAKRAILTVGEEGKEEYREYVIELGALDPVTVLSGIQARLNNLGFFCGSPDGVVGPHTQFALQEFQRSEDLEVTGQLDAATREALEKAYGDA